MAAEVCPFALALAFGQRGFGKGGVFTVVGKGVHGIVDEHVFVGLVALCSLEYAHRTFALLHTVGEHFYMLLVFVEFEVGLFGPIFQEHAAVDDFFGGVGGKGCEDDMLGFLLALVAFGEFGDIAVESIHVVHPPIGGHYLEAVLGGVVVDKGERKSDTEFGGIGTLGQQAIGGETGGVLEAGA